MTKLPDDQKVDFPAFTRQSVYSQSTLFKTYHYDAQDPLMRVLGCTHRSRSRILRDFALDASPIRA